MAQGTDTRELTKAYFQARGGEKLYVHFNPQSLQYDITNKLEEKGNGAKTKQFVSSSTGKLSLETVFDTTGTGEDVRLYTAQVSGLMQPSEDETPPEVTFAWGLYKFVGMLETYKETIEFFSHDGVPLRATLKLSMANQDTVFADGNTSRKANTGGNLSPDSSLPAAAPPGKGVTDTATKAGNPGAARALANANGLESMRFALGAQVDVSASVSLRGPEVFASAGGGVGLAIGAGTEAGIEAGTGTTLGAGVSIGGRASAGVGASAGAFAGLRSGGPAGGVAKLSLSAFGAGAGTGGLGLEAPGGIALGGKAGRAGSVSMQADVGSAGELAGRIEFEGG